jgi:hypothetical protein
VTAATDQTAPASPATRPFRLAMLVPTLVIDVAAPIALFKGLEAFGVSPIWALAGGCAPPVLNNLRAWLRSRRLDPVGILMMASIASGPVAALISGEISSRIITDCLLNSAWGLVFLGSLLPPRPAMFFLIRSLVAGEDASRTETWDRLWRYTVFRSALRSITAMWGLVYFAEVLIELGLARGLTPDAVVSLAPLMNVSGTLGLIVLTRLRMRAMRTRLERVEQLTWPL